MSNSIKTTQVQRAPWSKGKLIGQEPPLKLWQIWTVRTQLRMARKTRDLALFNLAIDSKLRGCDLVALRVGDVAHGEQVLSRANILQHKIGAPVRFELAEQTGDAVQAWIREAGLSPADYLFPSRQSASPHLSTRQYARVDKRWIGLMGGDPREYGTHSLRRAKATLIYRRTKNLGAVQLLLGHRKIESTVRYLGIEVDDALDYSRGPRVLIGPTTAPGNPAATHEQMLMPQDRRAGNQRVVGSRGEPPDCLYVD